MSSPIISPVLNEAAKDLSAHIITVVNQTVSIAASMCSKIPGSEMFYKYCVSSYQNDPFRLCLELLLVLFMIWYFVAKRYSPTSTEVILTEKEIQELIDEWEPEPLVGPLTDWEREELEKKPLVTGQVGLKVKTIDGKERLNFASYNFLGIMNSESVKEKAIKALRTYGVGTCGPRGFYGTLDVHLELENRIAKFFGTEGAIMYAQGFSCISSVIPAFAKRGDIIIADEAVNFAMQKGIQISRSNVYYFKHNDPEDLERIVKNLAEERKAKNLPLRRQFICVEGIYANIGDICNIPEIMKIKEKYKYRLLVEESMSLGVLGAGGRGVLEHFNLKPNSAEIIVASMANAFGAGGGFCTGSEEIVEHQRLSGQAYTFSASLPAMLTVASLEAINFLESNENNVLKLAKNSEIMWKILDKNSSIFELTGEAGSPIFHIRIKDPLANRVDEEIVLQEVVEMVFELLMQVAREGILLTRAKYVVAQERVCPRASIRVSVSAGFTVREIERTANVICDSVKRVFRKYQV